jgi:hypothetical protein
MIIRKKLPRSHKLHEPIRHEGSHPRPMTRRELLASGFLGSQAVLLGGSSLLGLFGRVGSARATLAPDMAALQQACGISTSGANKIPFICFDLAGGANLNGSEVLIGGPGGQLDFLSTAGYNKLGLPGNMLPNSPNPGSATNDFISTALGLAWHSDGAILRGILSKASTTTQGNTNGVAIAAMSQNDTQNNPHNPMYGIFTAGADGALLPLIGTQPSTSGGNSMAPMTMINLSVLPTVIKQASDVTGLVNTGQLGTMFTNPADAVAVLESTTRLSGGTTLSPTSGELGNANVIITPGNAATDAALKSQVLCGYTKSAALVDAFGVPSQLNPDLDPNIVGGASSIFTAADYQDSNVRMTAAVMKMVVSGYAGAGTISLGGFDYHDSTRATGETRNFQAGMLIGACLEYAQRMGKPLMVYVFSDGSLSSTMAADMSAAGRGKFGWQGDNSSVAATFFLVVNPAGRPQILDGAGGLKAANHQQIGYYSSDGSVNSSSSPVANAVNQLAYSVVLNWMALHGQQGNFNTLFPNSGISSSIIDQLTSFAPIAPNGTIS